MSRVRVAAAGLLALGALTVGVAAAPATDRGGWQREGTLIWAAEYANPDIVAVAGGWRAYLMSPNGIVSAFSTDGESFTFEPGIRVAGEHHTVAVLPDGRTRDLLLAGRQRRRRQRDLRRRAELHP